MLRDGQQVEIRSLRREDEAHLIAALKRTSSQFLSRRFLAGNRRLTPREVASCSGIDLVTDGVIVASLRGVGHPVIIGAGRYSVVQPRQAEIDLFVLDGYEGQGLGAKLLHHLAIVACKAGADEVMAEVVPEDAPTLRILENSGFPARRTIERGIVHVVLRVT